MCFCFGDNPGEMLYVVGNFEIIILVLILLDAINKIMVKRSTDTYLRFPYPLPYIAVCLAPGPLMNREN